MSLASFSARGLALLLGTPLLAGVAAAQLCPLPSDEFYRNDLLDQVPAGLLGVSVIGGLCEGEAAASIFDLATAGPETVTQVSVGYGANGAAQGFQATANIEIYDGISWAGTTPTLGPKVFDLNADYGISVQLTSHAINEFDLLPYGVEVGMHGNSQFVVAWRMNVNVVAGDCAGGYAANFFTDNMVFNFVCTATPQRNLIDDLVVGWKDPRDLTVTGLPICPFAYDGNWVIRACTAQSGPTLTVTALTNPIVLGTTGAFSFSAPGFENQIYLGGVAFSATTGIPFPPHGTFPLDYDLVFQFMLLNPSLFPGFIGIFPGVLAQSTALFPTIADPAFSGFALLVAFMAEDSPGGTWHFSNVEPFTLL
jgi:hypothetical protein